MLRWYLRQGWPTQLVVIVVVVVAVPILWTALASYLFIDLMSHGLRQSYPRNDLGSYVVWWDYFLADGQPVRVQRWLAVSAVVATLPFVAYVVRQVMDCFSDRAKRPSLYGKTGWASREQMAKRNVDLSRKPF